MNPKKQHHLIQVVLAALLVLAGASRLAAQESLIALGKVNSDGSLAASSNTLGGVAASSRVGLGNYNLTVTAAGAFAGAATGDFLISTGIESAASGDRILNAGIVSVTNDVLTIKVRVNDVENSPTLDGAVAADGGFYFGIRRIDPLATTPASDSRHLLAAGTVNSSGSLAKAFGIDGITISSLRADTGDYFVTLTKTGAFALDSSLDYLVFLSLVGSASEDEAIRGDVSSTASDDSIAFNIHVDDVQNPGGADVGVPSNRNFVFSIYSLNSIDLNGGPASELFAAHTSVDGSTGNLVFGQSIFPGGVVGSTHLSAGRYQIEIVSAGAFAGVDSDRYVPIVDINNTNLADEAVQAQVTIPDANTLRITVATNDVQTNGDADGDPKDRSFFLSLIDTAPAVFHDLSLSTRNLPATFRGVGITNLNGAGQTVRLKLVNASASRVFFKSENAGSAIDDLRLKGQAITGKLDSRFFDTTTGRRNITAEVKLGAVAVEDLRPGDAVSIEGVIRYKSANQTPNVTSKLRTISSNLPARHDVNRILVEKR